MKKLMASLLVASMALVGCGGSGSKSKPEIALITDSGGINDKSFNQSAWEAVKEYGEKNGKGYKYYKPANFDTAGYKAQIKNAKDNGAKVIVLPGYKFAAAMGELQNDEKYKDIHFVLIDFQPQDAKGNNVEPKSNVYAATFKEFQPGYLAGYAAVKDGYTKLGFMGGIALPAVINYGYGYLQGANDAAKAMNKTVDVKYYYTGSFNESPEIKTKATGWYNGGTEVIFSCGGQICNSIFAAAKETNKKVIGVDSDQKSQSETVITSAMKNVKKVVKDEIKASYDGKFEGGVHLLEAKDGDVGLSPDFSRFKNFKKADYDKVFKKVSDGSIKIVSYADVDANAKGDPNTANLKSVLTNVTVDYQK